MIWQLKCPAWLHWFLCSSGFITSASHFLTLMCRRKMALSLCGWDCKRDGSPWAEFLKEWVKHEINKVKDFYFWFFHIIILQNKAKSIFKGHKQREYLVIWKLRVGTGSYTNIIEISLKSLDSIFMGDWLSTAAVRSWGIAMTMRTSYSSLPATSRIRLHWGLDVQLVSITRPTTHSLYLVIWKTLLSYHGCRPYLVAVAGEGYRYPSSR